MQREYAFLPENAHNRANQEEFNYYPHRKPKWEAGSQGQSLDDDDEKSKDYNYPKSQPPSSFYHGKTKWKTIEVINGSEQFGNASFSRGIDNNNYYQQRQENRLEDNRDDGTNKGRGRGRGRGSGRGRERGRGNNWKNYDRSRNKNDQDSSCSQGPQQDEEIRQRSEGYKYYDYNGQQGSQSKKRNNRKRSNNYYKQDSNYSQEPQQQDPSCSQGPQQDEEIRQRSEGYKYYDYNGQQGSQSKKRNNRKRWDNYYKQDSNYSQEPQQQRAYSENVEGYKRNYWNRQNIPKNRNNTKWQNNYKEHDGNYYKQGGWNEKDYDGNRPNIFLREEEPEAIGELQKEDFDIEKYENKKQENKLKSEMDRLGGQINLQALRYYQKEYADLFKQLEGLQDRPDRMKEVAKQYERRNANLQRQADKNLPVFQKRQEIMDHLLKNKFTIVVGDTGCGKSTQLPQYLFDHYEQIPGSKILWVLPRKLPVLSLSQRVCEEMEITLGNEVGYEIPNKKKFGRNTLLKFTTDSMLINELIDKRARVGPEGRITLDYSVIVLDEVHERNLYTDILLASIKEITQQDSNNKMKMLITSATINEAAFENYFQTKAIQVRGRPHPVEVIYKPLIDKSKAVIHIANCIADVINEMRNPGYQYVGHILVFTTGVEEIIKVKSKLLEEIGIDQNEFEVLPLHGLLAPDEQQIIFQDVGKTKVILSTRIAETALTIEGVRVVIDIGEDKETFYDIAKRMTIVENKPIPQSSAIQRTGRAGRTSPGICIRLYSEEEYQKMIKNKISEIQRMDLGRVVLKLKAMGIRDLKKFGFIERPTDEAIDQTIDHLIELEALDRRTEELTLVGQAMLKLDTDPNFSKVILEGMKRNCVDEVIDIIGMIGVNSHLFIRGYDDDRREAADKKKLGFCHPKGDLLTLLEIYRFWFSKTKPQRKTWCSQHYFGYYALNDAYKTIKELKRNLDVVEVIMRSMQALAKLKLLQEERKQDQEANAATIIKEKTQKEKDAEKEDDILKCFLSAFYPNVCQFTNYPKIGYSILRDASTLRIHGASSLSLAQDYPKLVFCIDINKTTFTNSKLASVIKKEWLEELFPNYKNNPKLSFLGNSYEFSSCIIPNLSRVILSDFAYKDEDMKSFIQRQGITFCPEFDHELLHVFSSQLSRDELYQQVMSILNNIRKGFEKEAKEVPMVLKTRALFKTGGEVEEILLYNESRSLRFKGLGRLDGSKQKEKLKELFAKYGEVTSISVHLDKIKNVWNGLIVMRTSKEQEKVLMGVKSSDLEQFRSDRNNMKPLLIPVEYKLDGFAKRSIRLTIEWFIGVDEGTISLKFSDEKLADLVFNALAKKKPEIEGRKLTLSWSKNKGPTLYRAKDKTQVVINNLESITDEIDVQRILKELGLTAGLERVIKFRNPDLSEDSTDGVSLDECEEIIRKKIKNELGIEEAQISRVEAWNPNRGKSWWSNKINYQRKIFVDVFDYDVADKIIDYFNDNQDIKELTKGRMHCSMSFSRGFTLSLSKYKIIEDDLNKIIKKIEKENSSEDLKFLFDERTSYFDARIQEMSIRIVTPDPMMLDKCCNELDPILLGESFHLNISHMKKIDEKSTMDVINKIQNKYKVNIEVINKRRLLKIFGSSSNRKLASDDLNVLFDNSSDLGYKQVKVSFKYKPVRHILEKNAALLEDVKRKCGVKIEYSLLYKEITISGPATKVSDAQMKVTEMVNACLDKDGTTENECPICLGPFIDGHRLQVCGHKFCFSCLESNLKETLESDEPKFPICCFQCINERKKVPICLKDLQQILTSGTLQKLWELSMKSYLEQNMHKYFKCYTPNCPQIFKSDSQQDSFVCDYCIKSYCLHCGEEPHDGACAIQEESSSDYGEDYSEEQEQEEEEDIEDEYYDKYHKNGKNYDPMYYKGQTKKPNVESYRKLLDAYEKKITQPSNTNSQNNQIRNEPSKPSINNFIQPQNVPKLSSSILSVESTNIYKNTAIVGAPKVSTNKVGEDQQQAQRFNHQTMINRDKPKISETKPTNQLLKSSTYAATQVGATSSQKLTEPIKSYKSPTITEMPKTSSLIQRKEVSKPATNLISSQTQKSQGFSYQNMNREEAKISDMRPANQLLKSSTYAATQAQTSSNMRATSSQKLTEPIKTYKSPAVTEIPKTSSLIQRKEVSKPAMSSGTQQSEGVNYQTSVRNAFSRIHQPLVGNGNLYNQESNLHSSAQYLTPNYLNNSYPSLRNQESPLNRSVTNEPNTQRNTQEPKKSKGIFRSILNFLFN